MTARVPTVICLLRNDLRYYDNEIFHWAARHGNRILPLYCFDPRNHGPTWHFNFPKTGAHRLKFLIEGVHDLRTTLLQRGSGLIVRRGKPEDVIPQLIEAIGKGDIHSVVFQQESTKEELDVEAAIKRNCDVPVESFWGSTLYHPEDVPFSAQQVPNVYTEFRKKVESQGMIRRLIQMPDKLPPLPSNIEPGEIPLIDSFDLKVPVTDGRTALPLCGGETSALQRLKYYLWDTDKVAEYKETRNGMIGSDYSTKLSSWLAHGCISPRQIYHEIKRYEQQRTANQSTYWVIFELLWRDYFKFVSLKFGDRLFYRDGLLGKHVDWVQDRNVFDAWKEGRTGVPYIDANMRELAATGFMSNRGRQNVASFLVKDLKIDWRLGAEWFESMLVDHDVCSNYGNWQYSAGIGNDPRQDRKFNVIKQGHDYDPNGNYVRLWTPELEGIKGSEIHMPWTIGPALLKRYNVHLGENYPNPIVTAPEWSRIKNNRGGSGRPNSSRGGGARGRGQARGMDFYFKNSSK